PAAAAQLAAAARPRQGAARPRKGVARAQRRRWPAPRLPPRLMRRRGSASIVANPVLVGAVTTLVVVVAVFLSYIANNGLPFVPTRAVFVEIKNGSELVRGNDVREGGFRVGVVEEMVPARMENGHVGARLKLKLDRKVGNLPADTMFQIRQRGSLGLKY